MSLKGLRVGCGEVYTIGEVSDFWMVDVDMSIIEVKTWMLKK